MPGFDGSGPNGMGPRSGGGFGYCGRGADWTARGGRRGGFGRGFGGRGGFGRQMRFGWQGPGWGAWPETARPAGWIDDADSLQARAAALEAELAQIRQQMADLEKPDQQ